MFSREDWIHEIIGIAVIVCSFVFAWYMMDYHKFTEAPLNLAEHDQYFELKAGSSIYSVANEFEQKGWIKNADYLRIYAKLNDLTAIKAGEYALNAPISAAKLLNDFVDGNVLLHQITLIEGWNFRQMLQAIGSNKLLKQVLADATDAQIMQAVGSPDVHPEGQFLPDTYTFSRNTEDSEILRTAHQAMNKALASAWQERDADLPIKTPYEALILASIVEKETGVAEERPLIAGVFTTRLRKNMKLQTDPTVIYGMGDNYKGNIKRKHLREDTPYNTYVHKGLTPTPISMPGIDAIKAVLHPKEEGYLYFVSKGDGSHYFSKTLKEHNAAVRKYQLKK